ncbi:MAG: hypothetical protein QM674_17705 [Burkholderiaceae bacterium]
MSHLSPSTISASPRRRRTPCFVMPLLVVGLAVLALAGLGAGDARAQTPNASFALIGHIESLRLDDPGDPLSSGSARVKGLEVVLPRNLLITMPGQYLTLHDLFRGPHPGSAPGLASVRADSGLALADDPPPPVPYEMHVNGNIVDGRYVAALARIVQMDLGQGAGFVRAIDPGKGELLIGARRDSAETPARTAERDGASARVRLNDPAGIHGKPNADKFAGADPFDERFALDPQNASVVALTGFPMCIPRSTPDAACPAGNRAPAPNSTRFTCGPIQAEPSSPRLPGCDPARKAPLRVGDYVTYAGMLVRDPGSPGRFMVAAHALVADVGIYTSPGSNPAYVFIEEGLMGMLGEPFAGVDQEETSRFRTVGFTTDPSRDVDVMLVDVNSAGDTTERLLTTLTPARAGQIGRVRVTLPSKANFLAVTRDLRYRISGVPAGRAEYTAPIGEYIYPEATRFGQASAPFALPVPVENFCVLAKGGGRLDTLGRTDGPAIGRLDPYPESGHPNAQPRADGTASCE